MTYREFQETIWNYYKEHRRDFPWRIPQSSYSSDVGESLDDEITPYHILISEIMLQQTQADRVVSKYQSFIEKFPDFETLANASLSDVLKEWKGLGYNRRGLNLQRLAKIIVEKYGGELPSDPDALLDLPGIGPGTVGSLRAFAFNIPHAFIETNIRTVYIHFFFASPKRTRDGGFAVHDKEILKLVEKTVDTDNPREWFYALMDYGVMLKKQFKNPSRKSAHYKKQSSFKGSNRQLRAQILHEIVTSPLPFAKLVSKLKNDEEKIKTNLADLEKEGFITFSKNVYRVAK